MNEQDVVLGVVREEAWKTNSSALVEELMEAGPTTLRPNISADDATEFLSEQNEEAILITPRTAN